MGRRIEAGIVVKARILEKKTRDETTNAKAILRFEVNLILFRHSPIITQNNVNQTRLTLASSARVPGKSKTASNQFAHERGSIDPDNP